MFSPGWSSDEGALRIPPLISGGIMLSYRCTSRRASTPDDRHGATDQC
jgi:hypothetical protein